MSDFKCGAKKKDSHELACKMSASFFQFVNICDFFKIIWKLWVYFVKFSVKVKLIAMTKPFERQFGFRPT